MSEYADLVRMALKRRNVLLPVVVAVVVVLIWFVAFFLPQGKKVSTLNGQEQTLQSQVIQGNAKIAALKHSAQHATQLTAEETKLQSYVPATTDIYNYVNGLSTIAAKAGVKLTSVSPALPRASAGKSSFAALAVTLRVQGPYDAILKLITEIYALPRLTDIQTLSISGGSPTNNRSSTLSASLALRAFSTSVTKQPTK